jgi:hypothetical protein
MSEAVVVALITGGLTLIGTVISVAVSHKGTLEKIDANSKVADEKIQGEINVLKTDIRTLSNRVEAHNRVVDRTYELERKVGVLEEKASAANRRLTDIERSEKHD